jgi:NADPH:quinone reductase-like Zn-dependent oxidoreductase
LDGKRVRFFGAKFSAEILNDLTSSVEAGALRPVVDTIYPLSEIRAAHTALEKGGRRGKQIVACFERIRITGRPPVMAFSYSHPNQAA